MTDHLAEVWRVSHTTGEIPATWRWMCACGLWGSGYLDYASARVTARWHEQSQR